ncbi:MAG: 50S ribosomal protein L23 [Nanoarchaeota archaeon]
MLKPITTEKAVKLIDSENTLLFASDRHATKPEIKKEVESVFSVKVADIRTFIKNNEKYAYVRLNKQFPAIDVATKLGMI